MNLSTTKNISTAVLRKPLIKKLSFNLISQGSIFTGKWIINFTLAKLLSPSLFGVFTLIQALGNFLLNFFSFGSVAHLIHGISENQFSAYNQLKTSINLTMRIILLTVSVWFFLVLLEVQINYLSYFFWSILLGGILSMNAQLFAFFKGLGRFEEESKAAVVFFAFSILVVGCLWLIGIVENMHIIFGVFCALQCIILIKGVLSVKNWLSNGTTDSSINYKSFLKERLPFGFHEIQGAIYIHVILLILGFMVPEEELGMFRSVQLFITPVSLLPSVVSQVTLNKLSSLKNSPLDQIAVFRKFLKAVTCTGVFFFIIYFTFGGRFVNYIYDYKFDESTVNYLIRCFSAAFLLRFISSNYGVVITSAGKQNIRVIMTFLSILVSITLTYLLTKTMGVKGAALAGVASFGVITLGYSFYCEAILFKQLRKNASNNSRS